MKHKAEVTKEIVYHLKFGTDRCKFVIEKSNGKPFVYFKDENLRFFEEELLALLKCLR